MWVWLTLGSPFNLLKRSVMEAQLCKAGKTREPPVLLRANPHICMQSNSTTTYNPLKSPHKDINLNSINKNNTHIFLWPGQKYAKAHLNEDTWLCTNKYVVRPHLPNILTEPVPGPENNKIYHFYATLTGKKWQKKLKNSDESRNRARMLYPTFRPYTRPPPPKTQTIFFLTPRGGLALPSGTVFDLRWRPVPILNQVS